MSEALRGFLRGWERVVGLLARTQRQRGLERRADGFSAVWGGLRERDLHSVVPASARSDKKEYPVLNLLHAYEEFLPEHSFSAHPALRCSRRGTGMALTVLYIVRGNTAPAHNTHSGGRSHLSPLRSLVLSSRVERRGTKFPGT